MEDGKPREPQTPAFAAAIQASFSVGEALRVVRTSIRNDGLLTAVAHRTPLALVIRSYPAVNF